MDENIINGKIAIMKLRISTEIDSEKKKILQSELIKLNLRKQLEKQTEITKKLRK